MYVYARHIHTQPNFYYLYVDATYYYCELGEHILVNIGIDLYILGNKGIELRMDQQLIF